MPNVAHFGHLGGLLGGIVIMAALGPTRSEQPARATPPPGQDAAPDGPPTSGSAVTSEAFLELVGILAQQADAMMTGGQGLPRQPEEARRLVDYLVVLESQTRALTAEGELLSVRRQRLDNRVDLHLALGGGFEHAAAEARGAEKGGSS